MIRRTGPVALLLALIATLPLAAAALSGSSSIWIEFLPWEGLFDTLDLSFEADYTLGDVTLSTDGLLALPGTWVWQGFSAAGRFGGYALTTNVLFGPSTTDYLYTEVIVELSIGGIDTAWHAAQLSDAVFGGPADGWAVRIAGSVGAFEVVSVSEFGARIEDAEFDGITIVHAPTGLERHYATSPAVPGRGFTGQKISIRNEGFRCADQTVVTAYSTCDGFEYVSFGVAGIDVSLVPCLSFDANLTFEIDEKSLVIQPDLSLGEVVCLEVHAELDWDTASRTIDGVGLYGVELICELGPVTVRDVAVLDLARYVITTEAYGNAVERLVDAIDAGHEYYPYYWQLLSIAYTGGGCCGGDMTFLANAYFSEFSIRLFDWAMTRLEAEVPVSEALSFTLGMEFLSGYVRRLSFGFHATW